ncbi:dihydroorotase [[Clostridium] hylemonae]|uniref:Dihydroorotase n=1 Tax=[Clostridium] hylemonae DSM 15053 TaxID=553973 RepID=C0C458_9FIRM|nr:dihydroorotase [[Clostridium] hylemonae]EEG72851.1 amidohydrolase family protein [[Clostridium] hylemonae DSM 15053]QEK16388.1 Dihydroorotase [[Clostridium] hylemonae DSM 15053]BDF03901.1 dihydroorotase [[Clostridium] hylemonae]
MKILIQNGHVIDPPTGKDGIFDVLIVEDKIVKVERRIEDRADRVIDAGGCYVMPGFIDLHVHLRDPGLTHKETLETGGKAAVKGGITTMCAMPNTKPVIDDGEKVAEVHARAAKESPAHVIQIGAVTKGQLGRELADIEGMAKAGCHAISEDGKSVMNASIYRRGMKKAKECGISVFAHCEDITMVEGGVMNADGNATRLGLKGITNSVEDVIVARDILLAKETGARLHLCHCSTADSVEMIRLAKEDGLPVTGEVCPHHFILTADDIPADDGNYKMNPPLRGRADVEALREGLKNGIMDVISTDHAPHSAEEKNRSMAEAAFGIVGLETSAALTYTELVEPGILTMTDMAEKMSTNPARILGLLDKGSVSEGKTADIVIFDTRQEYTIDKDTFVSKGKNTPFHGRKVRGTVRYTLADGAVVYENEIH